MPTSEEMGFLQAIRADAKDAASRLAYADWLEERGRPYEAMLQRAEAGASEVRFKVRRKSDGLFGGGRSWAPQGKEFRKLAHIKSHILQHGGAFGQYYGVPLEEVEVIAVEIRPQQVAAMPVSVGKNEYKRPVIVVAEPLDGGGSGA